MASKYLDNNGVLYLWNKIGGLFATKNELPSDVGDLTNLAGYQTSAQVEQAITGKNYTTMTAVEGKGYQTGTQVTAAINAALANITGVQFSIVDALPETGVAGTIYLVHKTVTATGNVYTEWIYVNNSWETLGDTAVDMSDYLKKVDVGALTNEEIDEATPTVADGGGV